MEDKGFGFMDIVYTGRVFYDDEKRTYYQWEDLDEAGKLTGERRIYKKQPVKLAVVGEVYSVPKGDEEGNSIYGALAEHKWSWSSGDQLEEWYLRDRGSAQAAYAWRVEKTAKVKLEEDGAQALRTLNKAYWNMPSAQRAAFLAYVIREVQG